MKSILYVYFMLIHRGINVKNGKRNFPSNLPTRFVTKGSMRATDYDNQKRWKFL